jgi:protein arginine kinase
VNRFFPDFQRQLPAWFNEQGPHADIVLATRAELVRNLNTFPFPDHASDAELGTVCGDLCRRLSRFAPLADGWLLELDKLEDTQLRALQEMQLTGRLTPTGIRHRALMLAPDSTLAAAVNLQDHIRLRAYASGFAPDACLAKVLELDRLLEAEVEPAYVDDLGYLTSCPTDVGTGLHFTSLLHLPGLVLAGEIEKVLNALRQLQFSVRGLFGHGDTVKGAIFRISNLVTLGRDEQEIGEDFGVHVAKIITYERMARDQIYQRDPLGVEDLAERSLGVLRRARLLTAQEAFDRLSNVRLGSGLGILPPLAAGLLNEALVRQQTAHLELAAGRILSSREKSAARAAFLRDVFATTGP